MNAQQRKIIAKALAAIAPYTDAEFLLGNIGRAVDEISNTSSVLQCEAEAEQEKYDDMPEGLQSSERGEAMQTAAEALETAAEAFNDLDFEVPAGTKKEKEEWAESLAEEIQSAINEAEAYE